MNNNNTVSLVRNATLESQLILLQLNSHTHTLLVRQREAERQAQPGASRYVPSLYSPTTTLCLLTCWRRE